MAGVNKVILLGNLGKDPEERVFEGQRKVANFSLATSESYKDKNGNRVEQTEWHNIAVWGPLADIAMKFLKKGMTIYLEGKIKTRSWDDKEGNKRYSTEIVADTFTMVGPKRDEQREGQSEHTQTQNYSKPAAHAPSSSPEPFGSTEADDLPF